MLTEPVNEATVAQFRVLSHPVQIWFLVLLGGRPLRPAAAQSTLGATS